MGVRPGHSLVPRQDDSDLPRWSDSAMTALSFLLGPNPSGVVRLVLTKPSCAIKAHYHLAEALIFETHNDHRNIVVAAVGVGASNKALAPFFQIAIGLGVDIQNILVFN